MNRITITQQFVNPQQVQPPKNARQGLVRSPINVSAPWTSEMISSGYPKFTLRAGIGVTTNGCLIVKVKRDCLEQLKNMSKDESLMNDSLESRSGVFGKGCVCMRVLIRRTPDTIGIRRFCMCETQEKKCTQIIHVERFKNDLTVLLSTCFCM